MTPYYSDQWVSIYHGDCRDWMPAADVICTDPPYGMAYEHGARKGGIRLGMDQQSIVGDEEPFDPSHLIHAAPRVILWGANHYANRLPPSRGWLIWDKRDDMPPNDQSDVEMAWTNFLTTARKFTRKWSGATRGGREQAEGRWHVNQKPVALMQWCLNWAPGAQLILDPYAGSGSTLVAAKEMGIRSIGIEIDEANCSKAAERCRQEVLDLGGAA